MTQDVIIMHVYFVCII